MLNNLHEMVPIDSCLVLPMRIVQISFNEVWLLVIQNGLPNQDKTLLDALFIPIKIVALTSFA